jgi:hypothetical protein
MKSFYNNNNKKKEIHVNKKNKPKLTLRKV